jgi:hypothetical protein
LALLLVFVVSLTGIPPISSAQAAGAGAPALPFGYYATALAAGGGYTCILTTSGGVKCWGYNSDGELGNNSTTSSSLPVDVSGLTSGVSAISTGGYHTCALTTGGGVKCWGENFYGELGNNSTTDSPVPMDVSGLTSGVSAIATGYLHTCALTIGGGLKCWGDNASGQLGNNSSTNSSVPVNVSGLTSGVSAISAGDYHTCALTTSGGVKCWGWNNYGQLGNNSTIDSHVPVDVSGLTSGVSAIAAGDLHTCALTTGGGVKCWGLNHYGQLGNNSTTDSQTFVQVSNLGASAYPIANLSQTTPINYGQSTHFTANVTEAIDSPSGTIQFMIDGVNFGLPVTLTSGNATSDSTSTLTAGAHVIQAIYSGDNNFQAGISAGILQVVVDTQPPTVHTFTATTPTNSLNIPITAFTATDDVGVTGYIITTSSTQPSASDAGWLATHPTTYHVASDGHYTLYPWAKDGSGNVSAVYASPASVTVNTTTPILVSPASGTKVPTFRPAFKWLAVTGATKYQIEVSKSASLATPLVNATVTTLTYTPTVNLPANVKLYWSVRVVKSNGTTGAWTTPYYNFTIGLTAPTLTAPANLLTGVAHKPTFKWNAVSGATTYTIQVSTSSTFGTMVINITVSAKSYTSTITLLGNKVYYWRVMAKGAVGSSPWSSVFHFTTAP